MFATAALPLGVSPWLLLGGLIFFLVVEAEKAIIRAMRSREAAVEAPAPALVSICIQAHDPANLHLVLRSAEGASRTTIRTPAALACSILRDASLRAALRMRNEQANERARRT